MAVLLPSKSNTSCSLRKNIDEIMQERSLKILEKMIQAVLESDSENESFITPPRTTPVHSRRNGDKHSLTKSKLIGNETFGLFLL